MNIGIPVSYMTWCENIINKIKLGVTNSDADVATAISNVKSPTLIVNSKIDDVTPCFMGQDIYSEVRGNNKEMWTLEDSEHAEAWLD